MRPFLLYNKFMKKFLLMCIFSVLALSCFADDCVYNMGIQRRVDDVGFNILNANRIDKRMVFRYDEAEQKKIMLTDTTLTRRQIILYKNQLNYIRDENELAAFLAREIVKGTLSYDGGVRGWVSAAQMKMAPKKYEMLYDKRAVDLMVNAGYHPVAMIVLLNKTGEQKRFNFILTNNTVSKRLAEVYEYITVKYPEALKDNIYSKNEFYQNFLLTSENNRKMLEEKLRTGSKERLKYE